MTSSLGTSRDWEDLVAGGENGECAALKHAADGYARNCAAAALAVLGAFKHDKNSAELHGCFAELSDSFIENAPLDGAVVGWSLALAEAAMRGGPAGEGWAPLVQLGTLFVLAERLRGERGTEVSRRPDMGVFSVHSSGDWFGESRQARLHEIELGGRRIRVDPDHPVLWELLVCDYEFPHGYKADRISDFPFVDVLHESDVTSLHAAGRILERHWPAGAELVGAFVSSFMPVASPNRHENISLSCARFPGWIVASFDTPLYMAECLVHEASHHLLYEVARSCELIRPEACDATWYSPWRPDARPLSGLLHASFVFCQIINLYGYLAQRPDAKEADLARQRLGAELARQRVALSTLAQSGGLTEDGAALVTAMTKQGADWSASGLHVLTGDDRAEIDDHRQRSSGRAFGISEFRWSST
ncbi:HEXXH motif-containing putative peptide modification protein [Myxococcota bacterium]|nr:HEXXH motif-containing putative peptide modification protein [Myxococcota bacterium]